MRVPRRLFLKGVIATGGLSAVGAGLYLRPGTSGGGWQRKPSPTVRAFFGDLREGAVIGRWTVVKVHDVVAGAIPVVMATRDGTQFQVDITRRDPDGPRPVAETAGLALSVANGGGGDHATDEEHGLGAMALAAALRLREQAGAVAPSLVTLLERQHRFPGTPLRVLG